MRIALPIFLFLVSSFAIGQIKPPLVISEATINPTHVAFAFGGQLWEVSRSGGLAKRITQEIDSCFYPVYSRDGSRLAFMRSDGGEQNVYVIPARGGEPKPVTFHPSSDIPWSFSPDGKTIALSSNRDKVHHMQLMEAPVAGVMEQRIPVPTGTMASYSPEGDMIAYVPRPTLSMNINRRNERGGTRSRIEIFRRADGTSLPITPAQFNSLYPMWIENRIYFVQDREGSYNLAYFDRTTRRIRELTHYSMSGITFAGSDGTSIVFVRDGRIYLVDPKNDQPKELEITIAPAELVAGMDQRTPRKIAATRFVHSFTMGPDGKSVVIESRGDALVKPVGAPAVNHTRTPGTAEREATLSPNGQWLAYFSDETGEYALHLRPTAEGTVRKIAIESKPSFYTEPLWSPDSRSIAFSDRRLAMWTFDLQGSVATKIDHSTFMAQGLWNPSWSPDSRYLAYAKALPNHHRAIVIWDRSTGQKSQLTDVFSHAEFPCFDASGRYLYFSGSANARNASASDVGWALLSDFNAQPLVLKRLFAVVLRPEDSAPVLPYGSQANPLATFEPASGPIDWERAKSRITQLGGAPRDIAGLFAGKSGQLFVQVNDWDHAPGRWTSESRLYRLDLRKTSDYVKFADPAFAASVSADRSTMVIAGSGGSLRVFATDAPVTDPEKGADSIAVDLSQDMIDVEPAKEWGQMYRESWRMMREYFYDPHHHGLNIKELEERFASYLPGLIRRTDLNAVLRFAFGEVSISHLQVSGGDVPPSPRRPPLRTGLIGADWKIENGRYRLARIYQNAHFLDARPLARAPLDQPGIDIREGDYLIEVNGNPVTTDLNIYAYFRGCAQRTTRVKFASAPSGDDAREYTVVPATTESVIRLVNWTEANRRWVQEKSGGKLVYVHLNDFDEDGFEGIYRTVNGLRPGQGLIWDQRFNGGGITADALVQMLKREPMLGYIYPHGEPFDVPAHRVDGPVVLIANHENGSAAETFALMFKAMKAGTIVGTHTYGAGVGVALSQQRLIDGGRIGIPNRASHNPATGEWEIENVGVKPDIEIDITTADYAAGRDPQLEKAVEVAMKQLATWKVRQLKRPKFPVHPPG